MLLIRRLLLALLLLALGALPAEAQPPIWVIHGKDVTITLFGSVHLLPKSLDWEPPALREALARADEVWFEIPIDDASNLDASRAALAMGMQPPGQTLRGELSEADQARLAHAAQICGLPLEGLDQLKPWFADVTLSVASYRMAGAELDDGVERRLSAEAPASARRRAFETPAEQIGYLSSAPLGDQLDSLRETLDEVDDGAALYQRLLDAWVAGDVGGVVREALTPLAEKAPGTYRTLVVNRNRRWVRTITERLKSPGRAVIVVGVGHLVGPDSVPALLRARGIAVDGP